MNPATALAAAVVDELIRCGMREAVLAPGSRSAPLALELYRREQTGDLRLHVRIDERSAAFLALGLAKASSVPVAVVCTSGTAAAHFHAAVIEADQAGVPLLALTADRPPELRGTGANQTIDQLKLYGHAVRWFCELGVPEDRPESAGYWRSAVCRAWAAASGSAGGMPGPVHVNLALREPLVPAGTGEPGGRPDGAPWTRFGRIAELIPAERGIVVCGDGDYDAGSVLDLAEAAGWPVLAEPSSNARRGPNAVPAYPFLLPAPGFLAAHRPDVIVSAGRPGLNRGQLALLRGDPGPPLAPPGRHVVLAQGPGRWADPARTATDVVAQVRLAGRDGQPGGDGPGEDGSSDGPGGGGRSGWRRDWLAAGAAARSAVDAVLDDGGVLSEPRLARDLAAALPAGALLWAASSLPIRDLDEQLPARSDIRVLASRGASGIDGLVSSAIGAALAHQAAGGGPAFALLGDLALLHDAPGLFTGAAEPTPDLCLIVVNNDGGGIFSGLEQAAIPGPFERVFGTPHGADLDRLAAAAGVGYRLITRPDELADVVCGTSGAGLRLVELRTDRSEQAALRARLADAVARAVG